MVLGVQWHGAARGDHCANKDLLSNHRCYLHFANQMKGRRNCDGCYSIWRFTLPKRDEQKIWKIGWVSDITTCGGCADIRETSWSLHSTQIVPITWRTRNLRFAKQQVEISRNHIHSLFAFSVVSLVDMEAAWDETFCAWRDKSLPKCLPNNICYRNKETRLTLLFAQ